MSNFIKQTHLLDQMMLSALWAVAYFYRRSIGFIHSFLWSNLYSVT